MTPDLFDELLNIVKDDLQKCLIKNPLSPAYRLLITLHYLAEGCSMQELAWCYGVGKSTAHYVIKETTSVLWEKLCPLVLPEPTREQFEEISMQFYERWDMPNCFGAVDGKHVSIQAPKHSGSDYFNYKKGFSLMLLAVCDAKYCFTMVDIGAQGSSHSFQRKQVW
ncbi:hypothetical protein MML48_10g00004280 [Holotrichia oblita]|uniref:Uncharacterized protein n=1 Tax=Holotrichia oblita TaxID=644536 RepID=A0ACB9SPW0_HOLOL|nr:hypothetical protein MML48_10g00004280 [Holotrichia oblita]